MTDAPRTETPDPIVRGVSFTVGTPHTEAPTTTPCEWCPGNDVTGHASDCARYTQRTEAPDLRQRLDEAHAFGYREGYRAALDAPRTEAPDLLTRMWDYIRAKHRGHPRWDRGPDNCPSCTDIVGMYYTLRDALSATPAPEPYCAECHNHPGRSLHATHDATPAPERLTPGRVVAILADHQYIEDDQRQDLLTLLSSATPAPERLDVDDQGREICDRSYLCPHHTGRRKATSKSDHVEPAQRR